MPRYTILVSWQTTVEADSKDDAFKKANSKWLEATEEPFNGLQVEYKEEE